MRLRGARRDRPSCIARANCLREAGGLRIAAQGPLIVGEPPDQFDILKQQIGRAGGARAAVDGGNPQHRPERPPHSRECRSGHGPPICRVEHAACIDGATTSSIQSGFVDCSFNIRVLPDKVAFDDGATFVATGVKWVNLFQGSACTCPAFRASRSPAGRRRSSRFTGFLPRWAGRAFASSATTLPVSRPEITRPGNWKSDGRSACAGDRTRPGAERDIIRPSPPNRRFRGSDWHGS